eukprot:scaffold240_cov369-Pavlova_lutheri.AAC.30
MNRINTWLSHGRIPQLLQSARGGRSTHGGQLGPSALHVEGRSSSFSLGPLADSQRSCRSPSFGRRACSRTSSTPPPAC